MRQSYSPPARIGPKNMAAFAREPDNAVREIEDRERRRFRPFIWTVNEDGAHSFLTAIAERQLKVLRLPDGFEHLSEPARLAAVRRRVREHYQKTGGKYIGFGHPQVPLRSRLRPQQRSGHRR